MPALPTGREHFASWCSATFGPFPISAACGSYAATTFGTDESAQFEGAIKVANIYLAPILNTALKIRKAIRSDYVRVFYYDGQIAEFKIVSYPSSMPLSFEQRVSLNQKTPPANAAEGFCRNGISMPYSVNTGYWGSDASVTGTNEVTITVRWIDTGSYLMNPPKQSFCM